MIKKICIVLLICVICGLFCLGAKSCSNRNSNKAKTGSSIDTFMINPPSSLIAAAISYTEVNLSWQDNSINEDGFEIERSLDGSNFQLLTSVRMLYFDNNIKEI